MCSVKQVLPKWDHFLCWNILFIPKTSFKKSEGLFKLKIGWILPNLILFMKESLALQDINLIVAKTKWHQVHGWSLRSKFTLCPWKFVAPADAKSPICKWSKNLAVVSTLAAWQSKRSHVLGCHEGWQPPWHLELLQSYHFNCFYRSCTLEFRPFFRQRWMQVQGIAICTTAEGNQYHSVESGWAVTPNGVTPWTRWLRLLNLPGQKNTF